MTDTQHPLNVSSRKQAVRERDQRRCVNCHRDGSDITLDVHHIVPRGRGGSHRLSNMITLCRQCHDAAHGKAMAPCVTFERRPMDEDVFELFLSWMDTPMLNEVAMFHRDGYWFVPKGDMEHLIKLLNGEQEDIGFASPPIKSS